MENLKLVTVYESQGMLGAQVAKSKLQSAGIPVLLRYESFGQVLGLTVDALGRVDVQVPEEWAEEALRLLDENPEVDEEPGDEAAL
jgi:hypothetical protein